MIRYSLCSEFSHEFHIGLTYCLTFSYNMHDEDQFASSNSIVNVFALHCRTTNVSLRWHRVNGSRGHHSLSLCRPFEWSVDAFNSPAQAAFNFTETKLENVVMLWHISQMTHSVKKCIRPYNYSSFFWFCPSVSSIPRWWDVSWRFCNCEWIQQSNSAVSGYRVY